MVKYVHRWILGEVKVPKEMFQKAKKALCVHWNTCLNNVSVQDIKYRPHNKGLLLPIIKWCANLPKKMMLFYGNFFHLCSPVKTNFTGEAVKQFHQLTMVNRWNWSSPVNQFSVKKHHFLGKFAHHLIIGSNKPLFCDLYLISWTDTLFKHVFRSTH